MMLEIKNQVKIIGLLFLGFFLAISVILACVVFLFKPLMRWFVTNSLSFSVSMHELLRLGGYASGLALFVALVMWLEGKWKGRW